MTADATAPKQQIGVPFKPGQSGNPAGRPKGARNKLSEEFLDALQEDFAANGRDVIAQVRSDRPEVYLKVIAQVIPKHLNLADDRRDKPAHEWTNEELYAILDEAKEAKLANEAGDGIA